MYVMFLQKGCSFDSAPCSADGGTLRAGVSQAEASESHGAVAELEFDTEEAAPSGYDAFADLVQMAVREDPSLASVASTSGQSTSTQ